MYEQCVWAQVENQLTPKESAPLATKVIASTGVAKSAVKSWASGPGPDMPTLVASATSVLAAVQGATW